MDLSNPYEVMEFMLKYRKENMTPVEEAAYDLYMSIHFDLIKLPGHQIISRHKDKALVPNDKVDALYKAMSDAGYVWPMGK